MKHPQRAMELDALIAHARAGTSLLEVGSKNGYTLDYLARAMPVGSLVVSVDFPGGRWGSSSSEASLRKIVYKLIEDGYRCELLIGDSHNPEIIKRVCELGPYDLVFIDADHNYEAVKADWEAYGPMGKKVAFHDIAAPPWKNDTKEGNLGVMRLWNELKPRYRAAEYIDRSPPLMGVGVLWP